MRVIHIQFLSFILAILSIQVWAGGSSIPKSYGDFALAQSYEPLDGLHVYRYVHQKNGLTVVLHPIKETGTVALYLAYKVGSRNETLGKTGMAHLFEHMMFRGTKSFPNPHQALASWGGDSNAYTSPDLTMYYAHVPKIELGNLLTLESERMVDLQFTEKDYIDERGSVISERKMRTEDSPGGRLYWELNQNAFTEHPYKTGAIGWQEDLDRATFKDALAFHKIHYAPNRAVLSLAGDFSVKEVLKEIQARFGPLQRVEQKEMSIPAEPRWEKNRSKTISLKSENARFVRVIRGLSYEDERLAAESILCSMLADTQLGYLYKELVEKKIASGISMFCSADLDPGLFGFWLEGLSGISTKKLEQELNRALKSFEKSWITEDRLEKVKLSFLSAQYSEMRSPKSIAHSLAKMTALTGDPVYDLEFMKAVEKVKLSDVKGAFKRWQSEKYFQIAAQPGKKNPPFVYPGIKTKAKESAQ